MGRIFRDSAALVIMDRTRCRDSWIHSEFVVIAVTEWMNQRQSRAIDYLREENRVLREQLGDRRLRLTDD